MNVSYLEKDLDTTSESIVIDESNIKDIQFFNTTKHLILEDGSRINEGTEFLIENYSGDGNYEVHFCANEINYYAQECGAGYIFTLSQIRDIAEPAKLSMLLEKDKLRKGKSCISCSCINCKNYGFYKPACLKYVEDNL